LTGDSSTANPQQIEVMEFELKMLSGVTDYRHVLHGKHFVSKHVKVMIHAVAVNALIADWTKQL